MLAIMALVGTSQAVHLEGVPKKQLQKGAHWRKPWPEGIDDSTNDEDVLNWMRTRKGPDPPIEYHSGMRQWVPGTWPVYHTWKADQDWGADVATKHFQVDDGTDDNEVVNMVQTKSQITRK